MRGELRTSEELREDELEISYDTDEEPLLHTGHYRCTKRRVPPGKSIHLHARSTLRTDTESRKRETKMHSVAPLKPFKGDSCLETFLA